VIRHLVVSKKTFVYRLFLAVLLMAIFGIALIQRADSKNLGEDEQLIQVGIGAYQDGFYDIAEKQFSRFIKEFPRHGKVTEVTYLLAKMLFMKERFNESRNAFLRVIGEGKNVDYLDYAFLGLAEAEMRLGNPEGARKALLTLIQRFPRFESMDSVYYRLGLMDLAGNRLASAKQFFQKASTASKKGEFSHASLFWLGILAFRQNEYEASLEYLRATRENSPVAGYRYDSVGTTAVPARSDSYRQSALGSQDHAKLALFWIAETHLKSGRYQEAKSNYQMFSEQFKTDSLMPEVLWRLAYCEYQAGYIQASTDRFQTFKSQFKDSKWTSYAHYFLGEIYLSQGDYVSSINEFNSIPDRSSGQGLTGSALLALYWNRIQINDRDEANRVSQRLLKSAHFDDEKNLNQWMLAEMTFSEGRILDSLPFYFNIINTRFREIALVRIGEGYFFEKKYREAATNFDILLLEFPNSIYTDECLFLKGESLFRMGDIAPALIVLDVILQKKTTPAWRLLAMIQAANIHLVQINEDAAERLFRQVIESFPNHPMAYYAAFQLGNLHFKEKNIGEAIRFYSLVLKGNILELAGEVYFRMGEIFYQQEKYDKALKNFEIAVQYLKETSFWFFLTQLEIGNLQRRWGKFEEARKSYRIILDQSEDEDIRRAAKELLIRLEAK